MPDVQDMDIDKSLVLGWKMNSRLDPVYWLKDGAKPSQQTAADLALAPGRSMANHTAIVAQSGSGKSYFLGRLVEEIILKTKARCLIIDPNSDFKNVSEIVDDTLWSNAGYDSQRRTGKLPHEATRQAFELLWAPIIKRIYTAPDQPAAAPQETMEVLWTNIEFKFLAGNVEPLFS